MNTALTYQYRDGDNLRRFGTVIFKGLYPHGEDRLIKDLRQACMAGSRHNLPGMFIAEQVGLPEVFLWKEKGYVVDPRIDHCFHELLTAEKTRRGNSDKRTPAEVLAVFRFAAREGWAVFDLAEGTRA